MFNCFSMMKSNNNNDINNIFHINPFRVKRSYNTMLEQNHTLPYTVHFYSKRLKLSEVKPSESLIKSNKPKIPEKLLKEIERYNYQRHAYNMKLISCPCDNKSA